jgi:hypothetical protein
MAAKIRENSREFSLSWEEFEKAFYRIEVNAEALDVIHLKSAGSC